MSSKCFGGIGSRSTPEEILEFEFNIAMKLAEDGWTLRSGGADGSDSAFEYGFLNTRHSNKMEIYLPWNGFENKHEWTCPEGCYILASRLSNYDEAIRIAADHHPRWDSLNRSARILMARNTYQVLGKDLNLTTASKCLILWTEGGKMKGGTSQAMRIALNLGIPIFNLFHKEIRDNIYTLVKETE